MGVTDYEEVGELIGQGTGGGAIVSAANLDGGVNDYFENSDDEIFYGNLRVQPLLYQDDVLRLSSSIVSARKENVKCQTQKC